ncbi:MAG: hypothetical protein ROR55_21310 [Devosia sp.]
MSFDAYFNLPTPLTGLETVATQDTFASVIPADNTAGREDTIPVLAVSHEITAPRDTSSPNYEKPNSLLPGADVGFIDGMHAQEGDYLAII